jgi:hypothetical protein
MRATTWSKHIVASPATRLHSAVTLVQAPWNPRARRWLRPVAERESPDVVHVHNHWYRVARAILPPLCFEVIGDRPFIQRLRTANVPNVRFMTQLPVQ